MRVVFDTNIFVSAFAIPGGLAEKAIMRIIEGRDVLILSREIIDELLSTLARKFSKDTEELSRVAVYLDEIAILIKPSKSLSILKDTPDNRILECAVEGMADAIVTGDKALLRLKNYEGIRIISLREYVSSS